MCHCHCHWCQQLGRLCAVRAALHWQPAVAAKRGEGSCSLSAGSRGAGLQQEACHVCGGERASCRADHVAPARMRVQDIIDTRRGTRPAAAARSRRRRSASDSERAWCAQLRKPEDVRSRSDPGPRTSDLRLRARCAVATAGAYCSLVRTACAHGRVQSHAVHMLTVRSATTPWGRPAASATGP